MTHPAPPPHPGFGVFAKAHREFFNALADEGWAPVAGYSGVEEKILSGVLDHGARTGAVTRLARWRAGAAVGRPVSHAWCEEVFIISGSLSVGTLAAAHSAIVLPAGTYAVRPPHVLHGPFFSPDGCLLIEFMYYPPTAQETITREPAARPSPAARGCRPPRPGETR